MFQRFSSITAFNETSPPPCVHRIETPPHSRPHLDRHIMLILVIWAKVVNNICIFHSPIMIGSREPPLQWTPTYHHRHARLLRETTFLLVSSTMIIIISSLLTKLWKPEGNHIRFISLSSRVWSTRIAAERRSDSITLSLRSSVELTCSSVLFPPLPHFPGWEWRFPDSFLSKWQIVDPPHYIIATYQVTEQKLIIAIQRYHRNQLSPFVASDISLISRLTQLTLPTKERPQKVELLSVYVDIRFQ